MSASAEILTEKATEVLTLPIQCVATRENPAYKDDPTLEELLEVVFVISGDTVRQVEVTTGLQDDTNIQMLSGVSAGDQVAEGPYTALSRGLNNGEKVIVVKEEDYYNEFANND